MMSKNQIRMIPIILIHPPDPDAEEAIVNRRNQPQIIQKKIDLDGDDAIEKKIMIHLLILLAAEDGIAPKNLIGTLLPDHLVYGEAATTNRTLAIPPLHQKIIPEDLHHPNLPGEKDLNLVLHQNRVGEQWFGSLRLPSTPLRASRSEQAAHQPGAGANSRSPVQPSTVNIILKIFPGTDVDDMLSLYFVKKCNLTLSGI
jgi:hypothetical protein